MDGRTLCRGLPCSMFQVVQKLKSVKIKLNNLYRTKFSNLQVIDSVVLKVLEECQKQLHSYPGDKTLGENELKATAEYKMVHSLYTSFLYQKAKLACIQNGVENNRVFTKLLKQGGFRIMFTRFII